MEAEALPKQVLYDIQKINKIYAQICTKTDTTNRNNNQLKLIIDFIQAVNHDTRATY